MGILGDLASGAINFGFGQAAAAVDWKREQKKMQIEQDNALAQMAQSQAYNVENMERQNQYQIEAEQRANEYNSVGAQVERARAAGVSPAAALGSGGAGGLMSVAPAPSSSTPSPAGAPSGGAPRSNPGHGVDLSSSALEGRQESLVREQQEYYKQLAIGQAVQNEVDEYSKNFDKMARRYIADKTKFDAAQSEFKVNTQEELHDLDVQEREERIRQIGVNIDNTIKSTNADVQLKEVMRVELWTQACLNLANSNRAYAASALDYARTNLTNLESIDLGIKLKYTDIKQQLEIKSIVAGITLQGAQTLSALSQTELNASLVQLNLDEHDLNIIEKDLAQFRATFEKEHKEKDWRFDRRMQRKQTRAYSKMADASMLNGLSNVTMAACRAVGTMATFGFGGVGATPVSSAGALPPYVTGFGVPQY